MAVQFVCECGKKISVSEEMVGKRVRCPACQRVITVPTDDGGDERDDRPRSRSRGETKKKSSTMLYVGIGASVLLLSCCCLGGLVGAFFFFVLPSDKVLAGSFPIEESGTWTSMDRKTEVVEQLKFPLKVPYKAYKVPLKANTTYVIDLLPVGPGTDPYLVLEDPDGKRVAANDDYAFPRLDAKIVYTPTKDGDYRILAATIKELGAFKLKIAEAKPGKGPGFDDKGIKAGGDGPIKALTIPANERGQWTAQDPIHPLQRSAYKTYKVTLKAAKVYTIDLIGNEPRQDPYLYLTDTNGNILAQDDDSGQGLNARIIFTATQAGEYRIIATNHNQCMGNYTLSIREGAK
jgi:hypothetical protein